MSRNRDQVPAAHATLVSVLRQRARDHGDRPLYTFLADGETEQASLTYAELDARCRAIAAELEARGARDQRALMLFPPGLDFAAAFLGCLYAGTVAVPAYPPITRRHLPRLRSIAADARPELVITTADALEKLRTSTGQLDELDGARWLATDAVEPGRAGEWRDPGIDAGSLAFLQYTSGSTASPKGVMVSHGNLLDNEETIRRTFDQSESSIIVGWLPLYHDMGLIGNLLQPLYVGARCILMSPMAFLQKPTRWLAAISRYRGTTSGGPDFAYELCSRRVSPEERDELDLSCWRVAFSGSEPVRADTLERFAETFAGRGFRRRAFFPCYGMAETTLMISGGDPQAPPIVKELAAGALERSRVAPPAAGEARRRAVACGRPGQGFDVRIVDPETRSPCAADQVGEIWVRGASVAQGYWQRPEATDEAFQARLADGQGPFLRTGDLGFTTGGELYVTGRRKDLIIIRGRNHYPQDLELTAERSHRSLRPGCGAAVAAEIDGEERLVILHEVERRPRDVPGVIADAIRRAVAEEHAVQVHEVVLIRVGSILKTSSGKIRRRACLAAWRDDRLNVLGRSAVSSGEALELVGSELELDWEALLARPVEERSVLVRRFVTDRVARLARSASSAIDPRRPLTGLGLDSLGAAELKANLEARLAVAVSLSELLEGITLDGLVDSVVRQLDGGRDAPASLTLTEVADRRRQASDTPGRAGEPLSHGQRALWFLHRLDPQACAYNIAGAARVDDPLDVAALRRAFALLLARHEALRTTVRVVDGEPRAFPQPEAELAFRALDASGMTGGQLHELLSEEARRPFDLERGPLLRVVLAQGPETGRNTLIVTVHHIVADFSSLAVLGRELGELYGAETTGALASLPPLTVTQGDYARWQRAVMDGPEGERLWHYWQRQLGGELPVLDLPTDRPRPQIQSFAGSTRGRRLSQRLSTELGQLARRHGVTLYTALLAAYQILLHRLSGQRDLLVGTPMRVRGSSELLPMVGYLVNPVVLRARFPAGVRTTFDDVLAQARQALREARDHQEYPFGLLAERLRPDHDPGRAPIFQTMFVWHSDFSDRAAEASGLAGFAVGEAGHRLELGSLALESVALPRHASQFDLTLTMAEIDGRLSAALEVASALFDATTADRLLDRLEALLTAIADPELRRLPVADLPLLGAVEHHQLCREWNDRPLPPAGPEGLLLHRLFQAQVARTPSAVAIETADGRSLTYRQLGAAAGRLARHLRGLGVRPEITVGLCSDRCPEMVIGLLGILEAGGVYVPLDPAYPAQRLLFTLEDSRVPVLLAHGDLPESLSGVAAHRVDLADFAPGEVAADEAPPLDAGAAPDNLAYLIYTSGSTGRPKGVAISHRSAATLVRWSAADASPADLAGVLASTSICFDLSVFELFVPLCRGGRVVLAANALELPRLEDAGVTLVNTVPSAMAELAGRLPPSVATVNLAGEPLTRGLVDAVYAQDTVRRVFNLYGPSEDTTYSTGTRVPDGDPAPPTIGRPISASRAHLVDRRSRLTPAGAAGELLLGGAGLARGYLGRPALTAAAFVPDPFGETPGARLYRTGDLARHRHDGELEFLGRLDHQVKVRGFRIELGEIESALARHPAVREAVTLAVDEPPRDGLPGDVRLVAFAATGEAPAPDAGEMRTFLSQRLPGFMVPQVFVFLETLPLTPNGKIDRIALARLPLPAPEAGDSAHGFVAPETEVELMLAEIWLDVLSVEKVGIYDSFFDLGGHSLTATRVLSRVQETFEVELPLRALLESPTIAGLAEAIARQLMAEADEDLVAEILAEAR